MESNRVAQWVQVTATIGVLIGIVLVIIELQQAKALAEAEVVSGFFAELSQNNRALIGENPTGLLTKACLRPDEVTDEELFALDGYFNSWLTLAERTYRIEETASFGLPWAVVSKRLLRRVARLEQGRKWLGERSQESPYLKEVIAELLSEAENTSCERWLEENLRSSR